jgi:hypothetical protein
MSKWAPVIWEKIGEIVPYIKEIPNQLNLNSQQDKP